MAKISVGPVARTDERQSAFLNRLERRVNATPPGVCPISMQLSLLHVSGAQTCGKCVPCRDGIKHLIWMLERVLNCIATEEDFANLRLMAATVRDSSECAVGYDAGAAILEGLEIFADEYESHIKHHRCMDGTGQSLPCETLCPAHVDIPAYIALTKEGSYADAIKMIRKDNPFPTACALVCEHPCEKRCRRSLIDSPVNIRGIKKFAVDQIAADKVSVPARLPDSGRKIAVIGGGPSGLSCAYFAALMGHKVEVFEAHEKLGGMMRYGIPAYRFPRERLDEDLRAILSVGNIEVHYKTKVDAQMMQQIHDEFDAVYVAIGAQGGKTLDMPGADAEGVESAVALLGRIGNGEWLPDYTDKDVVVIGGGNVAMDCCRTSIRANAKTVTCVYRRRYEDMTALKMEVESAMMEGIEIMPLQAPIGVEVDENGHCSGVITQPQMISAVKRGRPAPINANKPEQVIHADVVLIAVGQDIESQDFEKFGMQTNRKAFVADDNLQAENYEDIFVGGDCLTGPATVIKAIGAGKAAARNIDEYLGYHHKLNVDVEVPDPIPNNRNQYGRVDILERPPRERKLDFDGVETEMTLEEAQQECGRCLRCDHYGCGVLEGGRIQYV